jgi:hypothetical protein
MTDPPRDKALEDALRRGDLQALANLKSHEELTRLIAAEDLMQKSFDRSRRRSRISVASQALVGYVALAGFFANAYQNWNNKLQAQRQAQTEQERWGREFKRAQDADKYRAFFETSALATDTNNPDKRLVGYSLLKEFVEDRDYNSKAALMLEESLYQELREGSTEGGLDAAHQAAVTAILSSLAETTECRSLGRSARTIERLARRHKVKLAEPEQTVEVFRIYVRRLLGRAAVICGAKEFRAVREPIRQALMRQPDIGGLTEKTVNATRANARIAEILRDECLAELEHSEANDCVEVWRHYAAMCQTFRTEGGPEGPSEGDACNIMASSTPPETNNAAPGAATAPGSLAPPSAAPPNTAP